MKWLWHTSRYYSGICLEGLWKTIKNTSVRTAGVLAEVWTGHIRKYKYKALMLEPSSVANRTEHPLPHRHHSFTSSTVKFRDKWRYEKHKPMCIIKKYTLLKKIPRHDIKAKIIYDCNYLLLLLCIWRSLCEVMLQEVSVFPRSPGLRTTTPSWQSECQQTLLHHLVLHMWCCLPVTVL